MPINKNAMIRYNALDRCFHEKRGYCIEELVEACNKALYDYLGVGHEVKKRQVYADINFMESPEGWNAPLSRKREGKKVFYSYKKRKFSISKKPIDDNDLTVLRQAMTVLDRFRGLPQFEWMQELVSNLEDKLGIHGNEEPVIGFEQNIDYIAADNLRGLFDAIIHKQVIHVKYRTFRNKDLEWDIHPYFLKQYNNRWFLFGRDDHRDGIVNMALDRILEFAPTRAAYIPSDTDFGEYFDDVIGVTIPPDADVEPIVLRFSPERFPYVLTKPLHGSMKVLDRERSTVELRLIPNRELDTLLLSFGDSVEVVAPQWYRERIAKVIRNAAKKYSSCADALHG